MINKKVIGPGPLRGGGQAIFFFPNASTSMFGRLNLIWTKKILKKNFVGTKKTQKFFEKKKTLQIFEKKIIFFIAYNCLKSNLSE